MLDTTAGSSSRMFGTMEVSVFSDSGGTAVFAGYGVTSVSESPNAALVASMLRWMYGASLSRRLGFTLNVCTDQG